MRKQRKRSPTWRKIAKYRFVYILLIPAILYFCVFSYAPLLMGVVQSFQKSRLLGPSEWAGFANYRALFTDSTFVHALINGIEMGACTFMLTFIGALVLALSLNEVRNRFWKSLVQTTTYMPYLFSWTVVGGIWVFILSTHGLINDVLGYFSLPAIHFMTESSLAKPIMILTAAWKETGYMAILFLASIVAINPNLFEAAQIDSASRGKQIWKIIIPDLVPTMKVVTLLGIIGFFTNFDQIYVMGNPAIIDAVRTPLLYIFEEGITKFNVGLATSASVVILAVTCLITLFFYRVLFHKESE
ncbi:MAG: sugar ABC transporter permease [Sporolactobacillus sp.]|jgi:putative aldouronate transport system permease protein|nr:sugar ABC transporter permease [Sporolactobacillus sp.]